jgi:hypothetical protein
MLRREQLCPGPGECPDVLMRDPFATRDADPCEECPVEHLDQYLASPEGRMLAGVIEIDSALRLGITITSSRISYLEFKLLTFLEGERDRYKAEKMEESRTRGR